MSLRWLCRIKHWWRWEDQSFYDDTVIGEGADSHIVGYQGVLFRECRNCGKQQYAYSANWYEWQDVGERS